MNLHLPLASFTHLIINIELQNNIIEIRVQVVARSSSNIFRFPYKRRLWNHILIGERISVHLLLR